MLKNKEFERISWCDMAIEPDQPSAHGGFSRSPSAPSAARVTLHDGLYDDIAEIFLHADVTLQDVLHHLLIRGDAAGNELQQVVVAPAHQVAFLERVVFPYLQLELDEVFTAVVMQGDLREHHYVVDELRQVEPGIEARYVAGLFEALDPREAGAWRQANRLGEIDVADPAVVLEAGEYVDIDPSTFWAIRPYPSPSLVRRAALPDAPWRDRPCC